VERQRTGEDEQLTSNKQQTMALNSLRGASERRVSVTALVECVARLLDHIQLLIHHVLQLLMYKRRRPTSVTNFSEKLEVEKQRRGNCAFRFNYRFVVLEESPCRQGPIYKYLSSDHKVLVNCQEVWERYTPVIRAAGTAFPCIQSPKTHV